MHLIGKSEFLTLVLTHDRRDSQLVGCIPKMGFSSFLGVKYKEMQPIMTWTGLAKFTKWKARHTIHHHTTAVKQFSDWNLSDFEECVRTHKRSHDPSIALSWPVTCELLC